MWAEQSVFYQIYTLGFCGAPYNNEDSEKEISLHRIRKVMDWIPHMKKLGINAVYFCPLFSSDSHGYNTRDYMVLDQRLGTNEDFREHQANTFAGSMLMPPRVFIPYVQKQMKINNRFSDELMVTHTINDGTSAYWRYIDVLNRTARHFGVSFKAARVQMTKYGLQADPNDDAVREDSNNQQTDAFTDWEATYEDEQGKLTKIINPELLKKLRPHLDTEYPSLPPAYNIITDFYGDRYPNMQLKDWGRLINAIEWDKCNEDGVIPEEIISSGKKNRQKIKVQFPDGHISNHSKVMQTLVDVVMYADPEKVRDLNIIVCGDNLVTLNLNPIYMSAYKEVGKGLYVNTASDTKRKYLQILEINDRLKLGLMVEIN